MGSQGSLMTIRSKVCRSNKRATTAQTAEMVNDGSERKKSEHTAHHCFEGKTGELLNIRHVALILWLTSVHVNLNHKKLQVSK